jgi:hypothetical protein
VIKKALEVKRGRRQEARKREIRGLKNNRKKICKWNLAAGNCCAVRKMNVTAG